MQKKEAVYDDIEPKTLQNLQSILVDIIAGDDEALTRPEYRAVTPETIQKALHFLLNNELLDDTQKAYLIANSWRINYRDRPPTPEEFITEKYLGRAALHTYERVKKTFIEFMNPIKPYRNLILYPHIGWGKAGRLTSKVYTPDGYKLMKDVSVGDVVSTPSGATARVLATFDQPTSMLYKITLSDGRSTVVHEDHLWKVSCDAKNDPQWEVLTTKELFNNIHNEKTRWYIPLTQPVFHHARLHIIPPYSLGVILGAGVVGHNIIKLYGINSTIINRIKQELPSSLKVVYHKKMLIAIIRSRKAKEQNVYEDQLQQLGLIKKIFENDRFIPEEYLYDSVENRAALLRGFIDTAGITDKHNCAITIYATSLRLAENIAELVRGLGALSQIRVNTDNPVCGNYIVTVCFPDKNSPIIKFFYTQKIRYSSKISRLYIQSITPHVKEPSKCILLDDDEHLYLTDEYIVTHNSYAATLVNIYVGIHLSLMRNPYKYFGLNPASILSQLLISYSLKKSSELLLEPLIAILEASPFFEKVHTREKMIKRDQEYERQSKIDKIYWTTAVPTSAIQFSNGANFKLVSSIHNLLGLTIVTGTMTELNFFREAGKALALDTRITMADGSVKYMKDICIGDQLKHPFKEKATVIDIPYEGEDETYEITLVTGKKIKCNAKHLWPVAYKTQTVNISNNVVHTQFMLDHPEIIFKIFEVENINNTVTITSSEISSIRSVGKQRQKCITTSIPDGLFIANNMITHNSDDYIMRLFNDLKSRVDSRMKGNYFGRTILDSSPNTLDSPIDDYIVNYAKKDLTNYIVEGSAWKWAPEEFDMTKTFYVYIGGKGQPPRILHDEENIHALPPSKVIEVPFQLKQFFEDDIYKALKDRAGIPAGSADNLIYDYNKIEAIFDKRLRNIYTHITASSEESPARLIWDQVAHIFFRQKAGRFEFWYKPHLPRCVSVDQSVSQDVSCIAMSHVERIAGTDEQMYIIDFTIPIAPMGARINLDAIRLFIQELRDLGGLTITHISFDQFQSEASIQYLKSMHFDVEKLSVDLTTDPYFYLMSLINTKRIVVGRNLHIKNNLKSLKLVKPSNKTGRLKVDHEDAHSTIITGTLDWDRSLIGFYAKDVTDAIAASVDLLRRYHPIAYDTWDPSYLDKLLDNSTEQSNAKERTRDFLTSIGAHI